MKANEVIESLRTESWTLQDLDAVLHVVQERIDIEETRNIKHLGMVRGGEPA